MPRQTETALTDEAPDLSVDSQAIKNHRKETAMEEEKIEIEVVKSSQGFDNYRFTGKLTEEIKIYLKENGYFWSRRNQCYYPATDEAKSANKIFTQKLESKFFSKKETSLAQGTVQLESMIADLRAQLEIQKKKIAELENSNKELEKKLRTGKERGKKTAADKETENKTQTLNPQNFAGQLENIEIKSNAADVVNAVERKHKAREQMESVFDRVIRKYGEQYKDFFDVYENLKEAFIKNSSSLVSDARINESFLQSHKELVKLQVQELSEIIKESKSLDEAKENSIRYLNVFGNDGLSAGDNLYRATEIDQRAYDNESAKTLASTEKMQEYIEMKFNELHRTQNENLRKENAQELTNFRNGKIASGSVTQDLNSSLSHTKKQLTEIRSKCREILKKTDSEITEDDKKILSQYEGAGGLNESNRSVNGVLNEFYTPQNLVDKVWKLVDHYALDAKTVLEPSSGTGKFANNRAQNEFTMHEIDDTSARIAKILHPGANVIQGAYQRQFFDDGGRVRKANFVQPKYDVVVGNPPYGKYNDIYKGLGEGKEFDRYEEYFISKGLDALKDEKSVLAFIVPSGFLKSANDSQKKILAQKGELIDAYRLPNKAFPTTEVGTDIIVMKTWDEKKRKLEWQSKDNDAYQKAEIQSWTEKEAFKLSNDQWFKKHPEKILGETKEITNRFGKPDFEVALPDGASLDDELKRIDGFLENNSQVEEPAETEQELAGNVNNNSEITEAAKRRDTIDKIMAKSKSVWDSQNKDWQNITRSFNRAIINEDYKEAKNVFGSMKNDKPFNAYVDLWKQALYIRDGKSSKLEQFENYLAEHEEDFLQEKDQEGDELASSWANEDFERTQRINEIVSEIQKSDFKMEVSVKNDLRKVVLTNKKGEEIFREQETGNSIVPITSNVAAWANDAESERFKNLADEYFNIISEDGITGGDFVNKVFEKNEEPDLKTYHTLKEEDVKDLKIVSDEELIQIYKQKYPDSSLNISEETKKELENVFSEIDNYLDKGTVPEESRFTLPKTPSYLQELGSDETVISLPVSVIKKAKGTHGLSNEEIKNSLLRFYDPVVVFDTDKTKSENKQNSKLILTDEFAGNKPIALAVNTNANIRISNGKQSLEVQDIRSIHDRTLISKNGTDLIKQWTENGLCRYVDDKKITDWSNVSRVYFPIDELQSDKNNILIKSELVNSIDSSPSWSSIAERAEGKGDGISEIDNAVVAVGVAPTIQTLRTRASSTALRASATTVNENISQSAQKSNILSEVSTSEITTEERAKYFVKSTAEFDQFADFEPITNLTGDEAVAKYKELQAEGVHCGIGINIEGDRVFDDKDGNGITVLVRNSEGKDTFNIYGDSFVKNLKESDQHSFDVLIAFDTLYKTAKEAGLDVEDAPYIAEKENELFGTLFNQNQQTAGKFEKAQKSKQSITKQKGEVMSAEEFSHLYGRDFDELEFPIWKATDWQGNIDLSKLTDADKAYLSESKNYVQKNFGEWTHKELFTTGDIYAKIEEQKTLFEKSGHNVLFAENIGLLESAKKPQLSMEHIHFGAKTTLAEEFTIPHLDADGNKVDLNLQESFILWAQNRTLETQDGRSWIDFATANISREELPENISWSDIVNYIDGTPVKADALRGWRTYDMSEEEKKAEKAERKREADLKRQTRSDTADRLFDRYLHEGLDDGTRARLVFEYNRRFNSYIIPDYSKLPLFVDGMSAYKGESKFKLYDQQIKGISFLCNKGNGLLAYDVGVGKTAAGIVATVNQIQTGRSKRPLIVVPNQVYAKWYADIRELFPNIKVNDLYNFNQESAGKYIDERNPHKLNIPENSISLCTYEALKNITFTDESCENALYEDFSNLLSADFDGSDRENAQSTDKIKEIIGAASHVKDSSYYFFEDCGFDNLTVDEAHNFKNLWVVPRPKKKGSSNEYSGIPSGKPSARALKLYGMTQLTQRNNDDRNVFLLTATPFTNSPTEVYSMLSYIGRKRLQESGLSSLRSFFDEFAKTKQELGVTSNGNIDTKQVMKNWKELPALQNILTEFIDKVDGEEAGIIRPNKFTHVKPLDMSELQKQMREIDEERMAEVKEGNSAAVIVAMNNMRLSCVAPALANPAMYPGVDLPPLSELVETSPKLKFVCDSIIDMYKGNPEKGQFMYVPLGKESHGVIKDYLVSHGIPKEAVEIINGEVNNTPEKKDKITSKFNDEKNPLKILIGGKNTSEGIDLNGNSFVMYNCSLGWNPSETIQAEGRIWRQGNLQGNVHIVYPVMNDSIDSVLYQKHDEKRSRINELWNYKGDSLNVEDINPEDLKIELIKDPQKKAKLILMERTKEGRAELSRTELKIRSFDEIVERRKTLSDDFENAKDMIESYKSQSERYKAEGLEVPEWIKSSVKDYAKQQKSAETKLETINEKFESLGIKNEDDMMKYIRGLNTQKKVAEEKIKNIEKEMPEIIRKLQKERLEQKLTEYPVEKQREILEADILNNLRPMKEVSYEMKTIRFEKMLSEKLKANEITQSDFDLYKKVGFENYEKWQNGEIGSLENLVSVEKSYRHGSVQMEAEKFKEKPPVQNPVAQSQETETNQNSEIPARKSKKNAEQKSIYDDESSLFFGLADENPNVVRSPEKNYFNFRNDDFSLTESQLLKSEQKRDEIIFPVLNGKESGMYKAFNNFAKRGVFDVQGTKLDVSDENKITQNGWNQLHAVMNIYRSKEFETMRYVLIDKKSGEIRDQMALTSHMPNFCAISDFTGKSLEEIARRAQETNCLVAAVHNHPSGNITESRQDAEFTDSLEKKLNADGRNLFAGHIILDHGTFNLYTPESGWNENLDSANLGKDDELLNKDFGFSSERTETTFGLEKIARKINGVDNWSDNFVPVVFSTSENEVTGIKLYDKSFFDRTPGQIRNEFQFSGLEAGAVKAFPVVTKNLEQSLSAIEAMLLEDKMKNLVHQNAFTDVALPDSTVVEKYNLKPGLPFFDEKNYKTKNPEIKATWQTRINPNLFTEEKAEFNHQIKEPLGFQKQNFKKVIGMEY